MSNNGIFKMSANITADTKRQPSISQEATLYKPRGDPQ